MTKEKTRSVRCWMLEQEFSTPSRWVWIPLSSARACSCLPYQPLLRLAAQRPYGVKIAGIPLRTSFDFHTLTFSLAYINPVSPSSPLAKSIPTSERPSSKNPPIVGVECSARETEIYLPKRRFGKWFRRGIAKVKLRDGDGEWRWDEEVSWLFFRSTRLRERIWPFLSPISYKLCTSFTRIKPPAMFILSIYLYHSLRHGLLPIVHPYIAGGNRGFLVVSLLSISTLQREIGCGCGLF